MDKTFALQKQNEQKSNHANNGTQISFNDIFADHSLRSFYQYLADCKVEKKLASHYKSKILLHNKDKNALYNNHIYDQLQIMVLHLC